MSKFSEIVVEENDGQFDDKEKEYLSPKKDFPMGQVFEYRIIDAKPMRQLFKGNKPVCTAFDAENGRTVESGWKDTRPCDGCEYRKGVKEGDNTWKCQLKLALVMEHEDPDTEYEVKIPYGSYIEFSKYVKEVHAAGFDIPEVMTIFKRIENPRGQGGLFTFEMGDLVEGEGGSGDAEEEDVELSAEEQEALDKVIAKAEKLGEQLDAEFAAGLLMKIKSVKGISKERALAVVNTAAVDGVIG